MGDQAAHTVDAAAEPRTASLTRPLAWYFGGLVAVYVLGRLVAFGLR